MRYTAATFGFFLCVIVFLSPAFAQSASTDEGEDDVVNISLLQVSDVHQFTPVDRGANGGIARLMTLKKRIAGSDCTLFLLAGDTISPSVESVTYQGKQMIDAWNAAGLDYATFGDHEFDFGPEVLRERVAESKFGWLGANVIDKRSGEIFGGALPYVIREFNGVKIGIIGFVTPDSSLTSRPGPDIAFGDPCETAKKYVSVMRARGAKAIIGLTHLPYSEDEKLTRCAQFDVILGGHDQQTLQTSSAGSLLFKVSSEAREVNWIRLKMKKSTGEIIRIFWRTIPVNDKLPDDPSFAPVSQKYTNTLGKLSEEVGQTASPLDARFVSNRNQETDLGNFITDSFRRETGADVAILNGGAIRADMIISPGPLTVRDITSILPFSNPVEVVEVKGSTIRRALENGVSLVGIANQPGRFPQISGMQFSFDGSKPPGHRVLKITVGDKLLEEEKLYKLATNAFILGGGDGYNMFRDANLLSGSAEGPTDSEILRKHVSAARTINPRVEKRITRVDHIENQLKSTFTCIYESVNRDLSKLQLINGSLPTGGTLSGYDAPEVKNIIREAKEDILKSLSDTELAGMRAYVEARFPKFEGLSTTPVKVIDKDPEVKEISYTGLGMPRLIRPEDKRLLTVQQTENVLSGVLRFISDLRANSGAIKFKVVSNPTGANVTLQSPGGKPINISTIQDIPGFWRGTYTITVTMNGFKPIVQPNQDLWSGVFGIDCTMFNVRSSDGPRFCTLITTR